MRIIWYVEKARINRWIPLSSYTFVDKHDPHRWFLFSSSNLIPPHDHSFPFSKTFPMSYLHIQIPTHDFHNKHSWSTYCTLRTMLSPMNTMGPKCPQNLPSWSLKSRFPMAISNVTSSRRPSIVPFLILHAHICIIFYFIWQLCTYLISPIHLEEAKAFIHFWTPKAPHLIPCL